MILVFSPLNVNLQLAPFPLISRPLVSSPRPSDIPTFRPATSSCSRQIRCFHTVARSCTLFALFFARALFVFNRLRPLFAKHPGWGYLCDTSALSASRRCHLPSILVSTLLSRNSFPFTSIRIVRECGRQKSFSSIKGATGFANSTFQLELAAFFRHTDAALWGLRLGFRN